MKKPLARFIICLLFFVIIFWGNNVYAQKTILVSDTLEGNVTWDADTVKVIDDVFITGTLRIQPGTYVEFQGHYEITADSILALGALGDSITFTIHDTTGFSNRTISEGGWNRIVVSSYAEFDFCIIEYGKYYNDLLNFVKLENSRISSNINLDVPYSGNGIPASTIKGCFFYKNMDLHLSCGKLINSIFKDNTVYVNTAKLAGNLFCNNTLGIYMSADSGPFVINNTFINNNLNDSNPFMFTFDCPDLHFYNNILYKNGHEKTIIKFMAVSAYPHDLTMPLRGTIKNNILEGGLGVIECTRIEGNYENNMDTDPVFADTNHSDFHLSESSPCINFHSQDTTGQFLLSTDLDGNPRIVGPGIDLGAYEFQGFPTNRPPVFENSSARKILPGSTALSVKFYDPDPGDICTVDSVISDVPEIGIEDIVADSVSVKFTASTDSGWQGSGNIQIRVSDNHGNTAHTMFRVIVSDTIQGKLIENTTWDSDTVKITGDILVYGKLTINPGTYIEFQGYYEIRADSLIALGNAGDSVTFTINDTTGLCGYQTTPGGWKGLRAIKMYIDYCRIMFVKGQPLLVSTFAEGDPIHISNSLFYNNSCQTFITSEDAWYYPYLLPGNALIRECSFVNNNFSEFSRWYVIIDHCRFVGNSFRMGWGGSIEYSSFYQNTKLSFHANEYGPLYFDYSRFEGNDTLLVGCYSLASLQVRTSIFDRNRNINFISGIQNNSFTFTNNTFYNNRVLPGSRALFLLNGNRELDNNIYYYEDIKPPYPKFLSFYNNGTTYPISGYFFNNLIKGGLAAIEYNGSILGYYENNIDADPLFTDTLNSDFHLTALSPCINSGRNYYVPEHNLPLTDKDFDGNPRIIDFYVDMGAYEYHSDTFSLWKQPEGFTVCSGEEGKLETNASGGVTGYQWQKDGEDLPDETDRFLIFPSIDTSKAGSYNCQIMTEDSIAHTDTVAVQVDRPLEITGHTESFAACEHNDTLLLLQTEGGSANTYSWLKNDSILEQEIADRMLFPSLKLTDEGIYNGIAGNQCGSDTTEPIILQVYPLPHPNLGNDTAFCSPASLVLSPGAFYEGYSWNTGSQDASILVDTSGTYWLSVTDTNSCSNSDSILVTVFPLP
jgi:parallel beta-helix repeat protein